MLWVVVLEKSLGSLLDCMEIKWVNHEGNQPWIFIGRTDAETEASVLWPPDMKSQLTGKDPDAGKDRRQEEKRTTEMVGWHDWLNGHEFEPAPGDGKGQPGVLQFMGLQRVGHDLATEQPPPPLDHQGSPALVHFYKHLSQLYTTL